MKELTKEELQEKDNGTITSVMLLNNNVYLKAINTYPYQAIHITEKEYNTLLSTDNFKKEDNNELSLNPKIKELWTRK